jgi:hypothetical protein
METVEWAVEYYRDVKGGEPVAEFIDSLPVGAQAKVFRLIDLLARRHVLFSGTLYKADKGQDKRIENSRRRRENQGFLLRVHRQAIRFASRFRQEGSENPQA